MGEAAGVTTEFCTFKVVSPCRASLCWKANCTPTWERTIASARQSEALDSHARADKPRKAAEEMEDRAIAAKMN